VPSRFSGSRFRSRSVRRLSDWADGPATGTIGDEGISQTVSAPGITLAGVGGEPGVAGLTIVRIRGRLSVSALTAAAITDEMSCAFAIGITTDEAIAVGATAIPNPVDNAEWDGWMYHSFFNLRPQTTSSFSTSIAGHFHESVDCRAMRKFPQGMFLFAAMGVASEIGTMSFTWAFNSRVLVKLP